MTQYTCDGSDKTELQEEQKADFRSYIMGYVLAVGLTLVPFWLVYRDVLPQFWAFVVIGVLALVQMIVHFRLFLHIGLKRNREDLHLILFSTLLVSIMIAGTIWIMTNLADRMFPATMAFLNTGKLLITGG